MSQSAPMCRLSRVRGVAVAVAAEAVAAAAAAVAVATRRRRTASSSPLRPPPPPVALRRHAALRRRAARPLVGARWGLGRARLGAGPVAPRRRRHGRSPARAARVSRARVAPLQEGKEEGRVGWARPRQARHPGRSPMEGGWHGWVAPVVKEARAAVGRRRHGRCRRRCCNVARHSRFPTRCRALPRSAAPAWMRRGLSRSSSSSSSSSSSRSSSSHSRSRRRCSALRRFPALRRWRAAVPAVAVVPHHLQAAPPAVRLPLPRRPPPAAGAALRTAW